MAKFADKLLRKLNSDKAKGEDGGGGDGEADGKLQTA